MSSQRQKEASNFNTSYAKQNSGRQMLQDNKKSFEDCDSSENTLAYQFSSLSSSKKKTQDAYFRHRGDTNLKIMGSNIDFIVEPEFDSSKVQTQQLDTNNEPNMIKMISNPNSNENDRFKMLDTQKTEDPQQTRAVSEEFKGYQKSETHSHLRKNFNIGIKVQKFINNILSFQVVKNYQYLKQFQLNVINDPICTNMSELVTIKQKQKTQFFSRIKKPSSQFKTISSQQSNENNIQDKIISAFVNSTLSIFSRMGVIHPLSKFKVVWQTIHLFFMLTILFILPVEVALFETDFVKLYPYKFKGLTKSAFGFFVLDIIVQLNTGVFDKGTIVTNRQELARKYMKDNFVLDIITAVTLFAKELGLSKYINLLILCKIPAFQKILDELQEANLSKSNSKFQNILKLLRLVIELLFIAHLYACIYLFINSVEMYYGNNQTWLTVYAKNIKANVNELPWHAKYMQAFYFCVTTMTTVGFGDITPQNQIEVIFCIFSLLTLCGVFAYSFNLVGVIVQDINKKSKEFKRDICLVNYYMEKLSINNELKYQVRKYLEYQHLSNEDITLAEESYILNKLSPVLKEKLTLDAHIQIIKKCGGVFTEFSDEFIEKVCLHFTKQKFSKGEIIFKPFQKDSDPCFYFIDVGEIDLYHESPSIQFQHDLIAIQDDENDKEKIQEKPLLDLNTNIQVVKSLVVNDYFGELSFYTNNNRSLGAICKDNSRCFVVQRSKFIKLLKKYPKDYELFCKLKDKMIIDNSGQAIGTSCFSCNRYGHTFQSCHLLQAKFDKEKIFLLENRQVKQDRNEVKKYRRRKIKFSALGEIQNVQEKVELKRISLDDINQDDDDDDDDDEDEDDQSQNSSEDGKSEQQKLVVKKKLTKLNSKSRSINNLDSKFNRLNSCEKSQQKSNNYFKENSIDQSNSLNNIQADEFEAKNKILSHSYLPAIQENESILESNDQKRKKYGNNEKKYLPQQMQSGNQSNLQEMQYQQQKNRAMYPYDMFNTQNPNNQQQQQNIQKQMMLASIQNMMLQREFQKETDNINANEQKQFSGFNQSNQYIPEHMQNMTPISPLLKPQPLHIDSPQVHKFGYRLYQTDLDTDPLAIFQAQIAKQQQQEQSPMSILNETPLNQNNPENVSIHKQQRQLPTSKLHLQDPLSQYLPQQYGYYAKQGDNEIQKAEANLETSLGMTMIKNRIPERQQKEFDTPYVIDEYMQEFKIYHPEYNYSVIQFKFPRTSKDILSQNPTFGKYTYFNRLIQKKNDRKKSRKQSERAFTVVNSFQRMSLLVNR